jgi:hypothetical protein
MVALIYLIITLILSKLVSIHGREAFAPCHPLIPSSRVENVSRCTSTRWSPWTR